jgi:hypothetical protein
LCLHDSHSRRVGQPNDLDASINVHSTIIVDFRTPVFESDSEPIRIDGPQATFKLSVGNVSPCRGLASGSTQCIIRTHSAIDEIDQMQTVIVDPIKVDPKVGSQRNSGIAKQSRSSGQIEFGQIIDWFIGICATVHAVHGTKVINC